MSHLGIVEENHLFKQNFDKKMFVQFESIKQ